MSKKKVNKPEYRPTRRYTSKLQKQRRKQRIILFSAITTIMIALVFVGLGLVYQWYIPNVKPMNEVVIEVNEAEFKMDYYIDSVKYQTQGQSPDIIPYFMDPVADSIIRGELVRQHAQKLGITVSDSRVIEFLEEYNVEANDAVIDYARAHLLQEKLIEEHFIPKLPSEAEYRNAKAMFLESYSQLESIQSMLDDGNSFEELAAQYSLDSYTKEAEGSLGSRPEGVIGEEVGSSLLGEAIFESDKGPGYIEDEGKSKPVGYWLIEVIEKTEQDDSEEANVRAMLLSNEEEALDIKSKLDDGKDFEDLASEYCHIWNEDRGAELGWITPEEISEAFDSYVFDDGVETGVLSDPIKDDQQTTDGGWWLFDVVSIETLPLAEEDAQVLAEKKLNDWMHQIEQDTDNVVNNYLDEDKKDFALRRISS